MSNVQRNLGRGLGSLIQEVSDVRAVPTAQPPPPRPARPPAAPPPSPAPRAPEDDGRRPAAGAPRWMLAALAASLVLCAVLAGLLIRARRAPPPATIEAPGLPDIVLPPPAQAEIAPAPAAPPAPSLDWVDGLAQPGVRVEKLDAAPRLVFDAAIFRARDQLAADAPARLAAVAAALAPHAREFRFVVAGHTDNEPMRNSTQFRDNADLGLARARAALDVLRRQGQLPAVALLARGDGEAGAPYPNTDAASKAKNRTVTIEIWPAPQANAAP